jgi:ketosteroid isomerase-like protein
MSALRCTFALLAALVAASPALGQSDLGAAAAAFAHAWRSSDADAIVAALAPEGVRLQLVGERPAGLPARQARAALSEFLGSRASGRLEEPRLQELGGTPPMGLAEFRWQTVVQGTSEPMRHTIFVGFTRGDAGWRINEIRVF